MASGSTRPRATQSISAARSGRWPAMTSASCRPTAQALIERLKPPGRPIACPTAGPRTVGRALSLADYEAFFEESAGTCGTPSPSAGGRPERRSFRCRPVDCGHRPVAAFRLRQRRSSACSRRAATTSIRPDDLPRPGPGAAARLPRLLRLAAPGQFDVHAVVHMGKHGNLEWLPGKALALSRSCFPRPPRARCRISIPSSSTIPGEGTQAKRRAQA